MDKIVKKILLKLAPNHAFFTHTMQFIKVSRAFNFIAIWLMNTKYMFFLFNPICAEIFSHPIGALSPVIAVIKGQTKMQMIKFCKKTNFEQFFNSFYRYLTVKPPKTVIHINASGRCIFYSNNLKFYDKARFIILDKISFSCFPPLGGKQR